MRINDPVQIADATLASGVAKTTLTRNAPMRLFVRAVLAGAFIAFGGTLSVMIGFGFPGITESNPAMQKLLSGCMFPIGLILVVVLGAELFTGNNALMIPPFMRGKATAKDITVNWTLVYLGNFVGAVLFTWLLVVEVGLFDNKVYGPAIERIAVSKVSMPWMTVFLKGVGANWCVCLAVWLAMSGKTLLEKSLGCWLPVMAFVALGYEHSIANMFYIPCAMMQGAEIDAWHAVCANLIPATVGNIVGGALLVGCVHSYLHLKKDR